MSHYSQGAKPIYLHVIRPMIKPYTATLDALLETTGLIGEFILILLDWPVHAAISWYRRWATSESGLEDELQDTPRSEALVLGSHLVLVSNHFQQPQYRPHSSNGAPDEQEQSNINGLTQRTVASRLDVPVERRPTEELNEHASSDDDEEASMVANTMLRTLGTISRGEHEEDVDMDVSDGEHDSFRLDRKSVV